MHHINTRYLRPKKAAWMERMLRSDFPCREQLNIWQGSDATVYPRRLLSRESFSNGQGGVLDCNGHFVALSANPGRIGGTYPLNDIAYRDEKVVFCGYLYQHWGHFLVESVSRLWYYLKNDPTVDKYVFILDHSQERKIRGNHKEFLELLGIWDKSVFLTQPTRFREVIIPEPSYLCMHYWTREYVSVFDTVANNVRTEPDWTPCSRIFFTRSQFAKGSQYEFGLDALDDFFSGNGFAILSPETFSLSKMIFYIRNAQVVASISGTLPHNMLFGKDGQNLIILERLVINVDHQVCINQMRQMHVVYIDANYPIYTVDTHGPYIVGCNHLLCRYAAENGLKAPEGYYASDRYRNKCFRKYMASYKDNYRYRWHKESWYPEIADSLWEAYEDSYTCFQDYLDGKRPFLREHYFQFHYWKQFIKRIIRK